MTAAVFFLSHDINSLLDGITPEERDAELADTLREIAPRIAAERRDHRHFGPYWWWVKPLLREVAGTRRSWIRGGYRDRSFPGAVAEGASPRDIEDARWMAWLGLRYREAEIVDDLPAEFHLIETADGEVQAYDLYDADASLQMDLFTEATTESPELRRLLNDPSRFSGSAWLRRADELEAAGETWRAAAALRRAISRAVDDDDRSRAWLSLGRLFQSGDHIRKAIFCYRNAFERDHEGWVQGLMGDAWLQAGEPHEALRCFRRALESMPGNPEYRSGADRAERAIREESRSAAGYTLLQERLAR
jgi:tetratricopeptide (TPR) repeat protein